MPHKRAKRSIREEQRSQKGSDQAPSSNHASKQAISTERIPKSVSRVLNAAGVREEWRAKKRKLESGEDTGEHVRNGKKRRVGASEPIRGNAATKTTSQDGGKITGKTLGIQSGESLAHFNRRVEDDMRPLVKSAIQSSSAQSRKVKKSEIDAKKQSKIQSTSKSKHASDSEHSPSPPPSARSKHDGHPKEFQKSSTSAPRRLNDIAEAPPEFKKLPRGIENGKAKLNLGREGVLSMKQKLMMEEEREKAIVRYRALKERRRLEGEIGGERDNGADDIE